MPHRVDDLRSSLLSLRPPVVVLPHVSADIDAVASAYALFSYLNKKGIAATLCIPSISAPAAQLLNRVSVRYSEECSVEGRDVVVVDTSSSAHVPLDLTPAHRALVVDHHRGGDLRGHIFDAGSTSEVVAELLLADGIRDERAFLLLAAGIYSDTAGLYVAGPDSLNTLSKLLRVLDISISELLDSISSPMPVHERIARLKALRNTKIYRMGNYVVVTSRVGAHEGSSATILVEAGADVAFVGSEHRISARMSSRFITETGIDLSLVFSRLASETGQNWGGHAGAAGIATENPEKDLQRAVSILEEMLRRRGYRFVLRVY